MGFYLYEISEGIDVFLKNYNIVDPRGLSQLSDLVMIPRKAIVEFITINNKFFEEVWSKIHHQLQGFSYKFEIVKEIGITVIPEEI